MQTISASDLLGVWEDGRSQHPLDRAVLLLRLASPALSIEAANALPLSQKEVLLLQLRERIFGSQIESVATCPACSGLLEFSLSGHDLGMTDYSLPPKTLIVRTDNFTLTVRPPTVADVRDATGSGNRLFDQILIQATCDDAPIAADRLPDTVTTIVAEHLQEVDPLIDLNLALSCPSCSHTWQAPLDITSFFWQEIDYWARRILYTVHRLASAYGWREQDILALSAWRRQHYLEFLNE